MSLTPYMREKLACAYFFLLPGLVYGIFTSRMPALKMMARADDTGIGFLLLGFGGASFAGLLSSRRLMDITGVRNIIGLTCVGLAVLMTLAAMAFNYWYLLGMCMLGGLAVGCCEVALNAQGIIIEKRYKKLCMAFLHACFSLGGMAGSLSGSLFAALNLSPVLNFLSVCGAYLLLAPLAFRHIAKRERENARGKAMDRRAAVPIFIYLCGLVSMGCYVAEGSVGEWGSILLHSVKGAPQDKAALVFGFFCASMVTFRFLGDRLREIFGDVKILFCGGMIGAIGMATVLLSSSTTICLVAYMFMGVGFAPLVPILFSRAGKYPGIAPARASSTVSIMAYSGLLVFPPLLGMAGDAIGLGQALWLIVIICLCVSIGGSCLLRFVKK